VGVLCHCGADPNVINAFGDNAITLLLSSLSRWLYHASDDPNRLDVLLRFTDDMLRLFLAHGLDARVVLRKNLKQVTNSPTKNRAQWQCRGAQRPKTVKGAQSDPDYVSRLLLDCVPIFHKIITTAYLLYRSGPVIIIPKCLPGGRQKL